VLPVLILANQITNVLTTRAVTPMTDLLINKGFESYINIVQASFYDKVAPYVLSFILSLPPNQMQFL
jgi:hypothetical protein